jgi:Transposase
VQKRILEAFIHHFKEDFDALLREQVRHLLVRVNAVWYARQQIKLTSKKTLLYSLRNHGQRTKYLKQLDHNIA